MLRGYLGSSAVFAILLILLVLPAAAQNGGDFSTNIHPTEKQKVPQGVILIKGAWSGASDSTTPVPEDARVTGNVLHDDYFGITYPLPKDWMKKYTGPPPSDTGEYTLSLITPAGTYKGTRGSIAITAQDMFFSPLPASNALELIDYKNHTLPSYYKVEIKPTETKIAGQPFVFFAYWSPVAGLHWYVVATEIRCHTVEFVLSSRDTKLLENLFLGLNQMKLSAAADLTTGNGGGNVPVCIKDYAREENVIERVEPVLTVRRYNAIPVRIIIGKDGKIEHVHLLSAFPEQQTAILDALKQWRFRPYFRNGQPVEVETGLMFGRPEQFTPKTAARPAANIAN